MNQQNADTTGKQQTAVNESGQGPSGDTAETFAGGGKPAEDTTIVGSGGGTDTGITGDDSAGGGLTGGSAGNALGDPSAKSGTI